MTDDKYIKWASRLSHHLQNDHGFTTYEAAMTLGVPMGQAHRIMTSMEQARYVKWDVAKARWYRA